MIGLIVFLAALSSLLAITMFTMVRTNQKDKLDIIEILLGIDNLKEELEQMGKTNAAQSKSSTVAEDHTKDWNTYLKNHHGKGWR